MEIIEKTLDEQWWNAYLKRRRKRELRCVAMFLFGLLFGLLLVILF